MSTPRILKWVAFAALLMVAAAAFAVDTVRIQDATLVNGQKLAPGRYDVTVSGAGPMADVTFLRGKTVVATAKARLKELDYKPSTDSVTVDTSGGDRTLTEIQWSGRKKSLVFEKGEQMSSGGTTGSGKQ
jgi:hypothetical protein